MSDENLSGVRADQAVSAAAWKKAATHPVLLHSGVTVEIKIPDLPQLIEADVIPQNLLDAALEVAGAVSRSGSPEAPTKDLIVKEGQFKNVLTRLTVVNPKLSEDDVQDIPTEDKEIIVEIATRQRDVDAEGNHISGLDKSEKFRKFRRIGEFDPLVAGE